MKRNCSLGFTLLELLIVMVIILILATFAYPVFISVQERAKITQDMNNLRQIGFATQRYLSDSDGVLFLNGSGAASWMKQLHPSTVGSTQYLPDWNVFQSPWDTRDKGNTDGTTPVSYGFNNHNIIGTDVSKITHPVVFIFFGAAQAPGATVTFQGTAASPGNGVMVYKDTSIPGGTVTCGTAANCGTQQRRQQISALCADGHAENMLWKWFKNDVTVPADLNGSYRWNP
jgi:prepilin-type N-terminal cleavage/methylation domain-containing protein